VETTNEKNIQVVLTAEEHAVFKRAMHRAEMKVGEFARAIILNAIGLSPGAPVPKPDPKRSEWHDRLDYIMDKAEPSEQSGVRALLDLLEKDVRLRRSKRKQA